MTAKLFRNSMAVAVSVMALSIALFMGVLYQYFSDQLMEALGTETWLVARGVELEGLNYLDGLDTENRVTWVAADGTVLFDSSADTDAMENHNDRRRSRRPRTTGWALPPATPPPWRSKPCTAPAACQTAQ